MRSTITVPSLRQNVLEAFNLEGDKQSMLYEERQAAGYKGADDHACIESFVGTTKEIECVCDMWTPRLLGNLFVKGTEHLDHSFHLVPLHQLVKWCYVVPQPGTVFTAKYVVGVRRVGDKEFVPALRLPLK